MSQQAHPTNSTVCWRLSAKEESTREKGVGVQREDVAEGRDSYEHPQEVRGQARHHAREEHPRQNEQRVQRP